MEKMKRQLQDAILEKNALAKKVDSFLEENKCLKSQLKSYTTSESQTMGLLENVRKKHECLLKLQTEEHIEELEHLQLGFKQWQNRAKKAEQDLKLLEQSNQQKTSSNQLKSQLEKMKSDHAVELALCRRNKEHDCVNQINILQESISRLKKENSEKDERIRLSSDQFKHDTDLITSKFRVRAHILEDQLKTTRNNLEMKTNEMTKMTTTLCSIENRQLSSLSKQKDREKDLLDKIFDMEQEIKNKSNQLNKYNVQKSALESENNQQLMQCRKEILSLVDENEDLRKGISEKDGKLCLLSNQLAGLEKKNNLGSSKYKLQLDDLNEEMKIYKSEIKLKDQEIDRVNRQTKDLKQEVTVLTKSHNHQCKALEDRILILKQEAQDKEDNLIKVTAMSDRVENESSSTTFKIKHQNKVAEDRIRRLEKQIAVRDEELCRRNAEISKYEVKVNSETSQQQNKLETIQEKIRKLRTENKIKEGQISKVSTKLAHTELEIDSISSNYRIRVRTLEDKIERLQTENKKKEEQVINSEICSLEVKSEVKTLKDQIRRMEIENSRNKTELIKLRTIENKLNTELTENTQLKNELSELTRKLSSAECDLVEAQCSLLKTQRCFEKSKKNESVLKASLKEKEDLYHSDINKFNLKNDRLQLSLQEEIKQLKEKCSELEAESVGNSSDELKVQQIQFANSKLISEMETLKEKCCDYHNLEKELDSFKTECNQLQNEKQILVDRFNKIENDNSVVQSMETHLKENKLKFHELESTNKQLNREIERLGRELDDSMVKLKENCDIIENQARKIQNLEKTTEMLKECCVTLENQAEELEDLNNDLVNKQNVIAIERDELLRNVSHHESNLKSLQHQRNAELSELDQMTSDQITGIKIHLRHEINEAHELGEKHRDLERRYKMLELNAGSIQRKLNLEKESHQRLESEFSLLKTEVIVLKQSLSRAEGNLRLEIDRCDATEQEKTKLLNQMETEKLEKSHELIKLNCTGAQQLKLIDFLQARVEELNPHDKKKNKKKMKVYQAPLQYRELCELLDEEKSANIRLQQQVNIFRTELQQTNTKVKKLKHNMGRSDPTPLSPGSIAAISAIVKSPAVSTPKTNSSPNKTAKLKSKHRMHHNIPHRLSTWLCNRGTRCSVCLSIIHFGHSALRCSECAVLCHTKCRQSVTNTCGLPGGLFEKFKNGSKSSNLSPISCVLKGTSSDVIHGYLKVLYGNDIWVPRMVRVVDNSIRILSKNTKSPTKTSTEDDVIDLTQAAYIHTDIRQLEIPNTAKLDVPYVFKIQTGSNNSCWPARTVFFLSAGFGEKHKWVEQLEKIASKHNKAKSCTSNPKIFGNQILALLNDERLEINCSVPISDSKILIGCDEGLFQLSPSTKNISSRANLIKVSGLSNIYQMSILDRSHIIAIEGIKHRLITFDTSKLDANKLNIHSIDSMEGCHLFTHGKAEGLCYIAAASATSIIIFKQNKKLEFISQKEIGTSEPCTCMIFTACSVIFGTNNFYEVDLTQYKVDEFLNIKKSVLKKEIKERNIFPVSVLNISDRNGKQEFILCYHELGLFVDGFGRQTRSGQITWSRMPISFEYRDPYLVVVQFNSVEIIRIDDRQTQTAELSAVDHSFLSFPSVRYLGPAITESAIYLSSCEFGKTSVFCCKGNMELKEPNEFGNKRHNTKLFGSVDFLASPMIKRSTLTEVSNLKNNQKFSASCDSLSSDTSHWTDTISNQSSETITHASEYMGESSQDCEGSRSSTYTPPSLRWNHLSHDDQISTPVKPSRGKYVNFRGKEYFNPLSSTEL